MNRIVITGLIAPFLALPAQSALADTRTRISLETGMEYFTGNYGSSQPTDISYFPVTCKIQGHDWAMKVTVPYLEITGAVHVVNGVGQTLPASTSARQVRSGLGDVSLSASETILDGGTRGPSAIVTGKMKLATASNTKGLGTGRNDYALETTLLNPMDRLTPFGTVGYKKYGSPADYKLNNVFYGSLGGNYRIGQSTNGGMMYIASQKVMDNRAPRSELLFFASHTLEKKWKVQGYLLRGLTSSVPKWGGGIHVSYNFEVVHDPVKTNPSGAGES